MHDRIGSGFAGARVREAREAHQRQLDQAFHRSGLHHDRRLRHDHGFFPHDQGFHHHAHPGGLPGWRPGEAWVFGHRHPSVTIISPPVVVINPYFCEVCGISFVGEFLFYSHLQHFHGVPAYALGSACVWVGDQLVFSGY
jgi:hypothetical protein